MVGAGLTGADSGSIDVVITGQSGTATSTAATLTVTDYVAITIHPSSQTLYASQTASLTAAATPAGVTVQWQISTDGGVTYFNVAGATSATLTLPALTVAQNGARYRAVFTNGCGSATTNPATLTVLAQNTITLPTLPTVVAGLTRPSLTVTLSAPVAGTTATLTPGAILA